MVSASAISLLLAPPPIRSAICCSRRVRQARSSSGLSSCTVARPNARRRLSAIRRRTSATDVATTMCPAGTTFVMARVREQAEYHGSPARKTPMSVEPSTARGPAPPCEAVRNRPRPKIQAGRLLAKAANAARLAQGEALALLAQHDAVFADLLDLRAAVDRV